MKLPTYRTHIKYESYNVAKTLFDSNNIGLFLQVYSYIEFLDEQGIRKAVMTYVMFMT